MVQLLHEVWRSKDSDAFSIANKCADELRAKMEPEAELIHVIYASSWNEAMALYHEWRGWAPYKPMVGAPDPPYSEEQFREQKECRP